ncbi:gluconokinase [Acetobacter fallax]|uniref:Gluconokinase n=1 Tax=Acetobacter fallax TaxID=1737473 RepID=A0ABX0KBB7_9PROT|nr:gluconokinase [Acetobacter fallax]NHO31800.1 AAA family ATPase [Acetobacter fallax]NHO35438.1 AAA family ATPase [Acetobacter fallax]
MSSDRSAQSAAASSAPVWLPPRVVVVMGVSGSGKTTVASGLNNLLGWTFQEGDGLHPPANVEKMAAGIPLTDEDRWPWLDKCRAWLDECATSGTGCVLSCSALKRVYRDRLRAGGTDIVFLFLKVPQDILANRMMQRKDHYMPPSLLGSQLEALELPGPDEHAIELEMSETPAGEVAHALEALKADHQKSIRKAGF